VTLRESPVLLIAVVGLASLAACGDDAPTDVDSGMVEPCTTPRAERYLPLAVGAMWTYDTTDTTTPGAPVEVKTTAVQALEDIGDRKAGIMGYRMRTEKTGGYTVSWQEDACTAVLRHREQSFDAASTLVSDQFYVPSKLRVDETAAHTTLAAAWTVAFTEVEVDPVTGTVTVSKSEDWTVMGVDEPVTVPAGTFNALHLRKMTSGAADKQFWFVKGVGKVKEEGEQREELRAFTLP